jgi:hypothetical protein
MSLHGRIGIGTRTILHWEAKRVRPLDEAAPEGDWPATATAPDAVNVYHCWVRGPSGALVWEGEINHRFGDGAAALAGRLLIASAPTAAQETLPLRDEDRPSGSAMWGLYGGRGDGVSELMLIDLAKSVVGPKQRCGHGSTRAHRRRISPGEFLNCPGPAELGSEAGSVDADAELGASAG